MPYASNINDYASMIIFTQYAEERGTLFSKFFIIWQAAELGSVISCIGWVNRWTKADSNQEATNTRKKNLGIINFVIQEVIQGCACSTKIKDNNKRIQYDDMLKTYIDRILSEHNTNKPITTVMLHVITSVTDNPTKAQAYCVDRFPRLRTTPPAIANITEDQFSYINHHGRL